MKMTAAVAASWVATRAAYPTLLPYRPVLVAVAAVALALVCVPRRIRR